MKFRQILKTAGGNISTILVTEKCVLNTSPSGQSSISRPITESLNL